MVADWNLRNVSTGKVIEISRDEYLAGRSSNFEIVCLSKSVSRMHAKFTINGGNFYVEDMKSANGTYLNTKKIVKKEQLQNGDIVGLGLPTTTSFNHQEPLYIFEVVNTLVDASLDILKILQAGDDEEEEDIPNEKITINNNSTNNNNNNNNHLETTLQQETSNDGELQILCNNEELVLLTSPKQTSSSTGCAELDQEIQIKIENPDIPDDSTPVGYSIEDDVIVIEDDDDCNFSSSQLFTTVPPTSAVSDTLLAKIKTELEEIDRDEGERLVVIDDSDSDNDWFGSEDIGAQISKLEKELNSQVNNINATGDEVLPATEEANSNVEPLPKVTSKSSSTSKYVKPPIIEPLQEMLCKKTVSAASTKRTQKASVKRKSQSEESTKRKKLKSSNNKNDKGILSKLKGSSRNNNKRNIDVVDKEEKEKIKQMRKKKLKELEKKNLDKNTTDDSRSTSSVHKEFGATCKSREANVKVSDGRGNFLLAIENKVQDSVQRKKDVAINPVAVSSKQIQPIPNQIENSVAQVTEKGTATISNNIKSKDPRANRTEAKKEPILITLKSRNLSNKCPEVYSGVTRSNDNNLATPLLSLDVIVNIINWKTTWLEEQGNLAVPPPVNKRTPVKMCYSFSSHNDYCNVVNPLLTLELWNMIYKEWLSASDQTRQQSRKFWGSIDSVEPRNNYMLLKSTTYITKQQKDTRSHVKESDIIIINLPLISQNKLIVKKIFAYVSSCSRKMLHSNDYIDGYLAKQLCAVPNAALAVDIIIRCLPETICSEKHFEGGIITSLTCPLREFDAVKALGNSPLCGHILDPTIEDYSVPPVNENEPIISKDNLCATQQQVVLEAVSLCLRDTPGIYLIQGPPGTGKTTVITNILQNILLNEKIKDPRVLLVAPSNAAVDGIILKINKQIKPHLTEHQRRKIKLLRIGPKHAIHDEVKPYFLDELVKSYVDSKFFAEFPEVGKDYCQLCKDKDALAWAIHYEKGLGHNTKEKEKQLQEVMYKQENFARTYLKQKYYERFSAAKKKLIDGANIISTTLSSCIRLDDRDMSLGQITCCIVDEATQSNEPETLIPLMLGVKKLILVGDPQQLPAVTVSPYAKELGHGQSLFARIKHHFDNKPSNPIRMLNIQYRMHPEISLFPSNNFYNGELLNSPTYIQREGLDKLAAYYVFNLNSKSHSNKSYTNEDEVDCVLKLLEAITSTVGGKLRYSVGIITPYNTQKAALNKKLVGYNNNSDVSISVNTVDSFQGSEKDVIILSCVRYSPNNFLSDEQRLNVAITRAKHVLYIIGTYSLFQHCSTLSRIKRDAENRNLYLNINCTVNTNVLQAVITTK